MDASSFISPIFALGDSDVGLSDYSPHVNWMDQTINLSADGVQECTRKEAVPLSSIGDAYEASDLSRSSSANSIDSGSTFIIDTGRDSLTSDKESAVTSDRTEKQLLFEKTIVRFDRSSEEECDGTVVDTCVVPIEAAPGTRLPVVSSQTPLNSRSVDEFSPFHHRIHSMENDIAILTETNESLSKLLEEQQEAHKSDMLELEGQLNSLKSLVTCLAAQLETPPDIANLRLKSCEGNVYHVEWDLKSVEGFEIILNGEVTGDFIPQKKCYLTDVTEKTSLQIQTVGLNGIRGEASAPLIIRPRK